MAAPESKTVVFYDGSCPLCRAEVGMYSDRDTAHALCLVDVSQKHVQLPPALSPEKAMKRFHVIASDGRLLSGAAAFIEVWRQLPGWHIAASLARLPGARPILDLAYRRFLILRPALVRLFVAVQH